MIFQSRINKIRQELALLNLDGIYVTNLTNVRYVTGFTGSAGSVLILNDTCHFFTDGRYIEQSKNQVAGCVIHIVGGAHFQEIHKNQLIADNMSIAIEADYMNINMFDTIIFLAHDINNYILI